MFEEPESVIQEESMIQEEEPIKIQEEELNIEDFPEEDKNKLQSLMQNNGLSLREAVEFRKIFKQNSDQLDNLVQTLDYNTVQNINKYIIE